MKFSSVNSIALFKNNYSILLKIYFYKKCGNGKIFFNNLLDNIFFLSVKKIINIIKYNFINLYKEIKNNNIYIKIIPSQLILKNSSISSALFINFFSLFYNIKFVNNLFILGDLDIKGNFLYINDIEKKINILKDNFYFIIIPRCNFVNYKYNLNKNTNLYFIKISNVFELLSLFKINFF